MGDAPRSEERITGPEPVLLVPDRDDVFALDDVEELVLAAVDVEGVSTIGGTSSITVMAPPESSALTRITTFTSPKTSRSSRNPSVISHAPTISHRLRP